MEFKLDDTQKAEIKTQVLNIVREGINQAVDNESPIVNRKDLATFLGVAPSTVNYWITLGMPFIQLDSRKLYSKKAVVAWLESKTTTAK